MIKIDDIEKIISAVDKFDVTHFEFEQESSKIVIDKSRTAQTVINTSSKIENNDCELKIEKCLNEKEQNAENKYIKASFAGTFYSSREQNNQSFVKLNDEVECNTVVGLIEVMKMYNEIEAGVKGTITNVLVKDGEFVEYGQPLFEVESK